MFPEMLVPVLTTARTRRLWPAADPALSSGSKASPLEETLT